MSRIDIFDRVGRSSWRVRLAGGLLALVLLPALASAQSVDEKYQQRRNRSSQFNLAASATTVLRVNSYQCGLNNNGDICTDVFDSPTGGGGFWPTGSANQYMFNSGLQIAGIIPIRDGCNRLNRENSVDPDCFAWAGDTTGAFYMDAAGTRKHAAPVTDIYDSLNPDDLENWPVAGTFADFPEASAMVEDTSLFNSVLIGRKAASQQDTWVMYWDGDPARLGGRTHPMGILVEQRSLAWNYPRGNENVIYFIFKFTNVTNNALFQRLNEERFFGGENKLPDSGWRYDSIYVAYDSDPDVTHDFQLNYATAILPFNIGLTYDGSFFEPSPDFTYPPSLFYPPFFTDAPGIVAVKYLKSPVDPATGLEVGLTSFSLHTNAGAFPDPSTVQRGWRYFSLNTSAGHGDPNCSFPTQEEVRTRRSCYLAQTTADVRFFIGSGPFSLDPGQSATVAVAQYAAATVNTPLITRGANAAPQNPPGLPSPTPGCFGQPGARPIEIASGWLNIRCPANPETPIDQLEDIDVVPMSVLGRAQVAQSIFSNKFLLGFAPEPPRFYVVPGDNQVSIVWEPSATEAAQGDPFFAAAGDPLNPLYDSNYVEFDLEGYRIYRGTSPANMELIAQFDRSGTTFTDRRCVLDPTYVQGDPCTDETTYDITHPFVQNTEIVRLANGEPRVIAADTALQTRVTDGTSLELANTGIPYAYIDTQVRNGFQYFYRVEAFDVNSIVSGPSSLESAGPVRSTVPRAPATTLTSPTFSFGMFGRGDEPLGAVTPPVLDAVTGMFSGPQPPTDMFKGDFVAFATQLLPPASKAMRIDSVLPGYYPNGSIGTYYLTVDGAPQVIVAPNFIQSGSATEFIHELPVEAFQSDPARRQSLIAAGVDAPPLSAVLTRSIGWEPAQFHSGDSDWAYKQPGFWAIDPATTAPGGSRWFLGERESTPHPTLSLTAHGSLGESTVIMQPTPYLSTGTPATTAMATYVDRNGVSRVENIFRRFYGTTFGMRRAADVKLYWGAAGLDSVIDVTHNVTVPFSTHIRASYGFLTDGDADGRLNYGDFYYIPGLVTTPANEISNLSVQFPAPLSQQPVVMPTDVTGDLAADGNGFGLYINGEPWLFGGAPPTNTVWTLRTYNGEVTRNNAGVYSFNPFGRTPAVPGLSIALDLEAPAQVVAASADLSRVHTVPDPYYATSQFDRGPASKELQFVNLPAQATIRIFSLSGILVDVINHNDPAGGGVAPWDLRNRSNQFVASGVYLFHVSTPDGKSAIGKFTVVNSGFAR